MIDHALCFVAWEYPWVNAHCISDDGFIEVVLVDAVIAPVDALNRFRNRARHIAHGSYRRRRIIVAWKVGRRAVRIRVRSVRVSKEWIRRIVAAIVWRMTIGT